MKVSCLFYALVALLPEKKPVVGPLVGLDAEKGRKISAPWRESNPDRPARY
jgi:hypothetical protein